MRCLLAASLVLSPFSTLAAQAAINNTASITATLPGGGTVGASSSESVTTEPPAPGMDVVKVATLNDDDGTPGMSAGDTVDYVITAENTGNMSLSGITASDPMIALTFDAASDGNSNDRIDTNETWRWTGSYTITQSDIDTNGAGDGLIENTVTVSSTELPDQTGSDDVAVDQSPSVDVVKVADASSANVPGDAISYTVTATNTGNTTLTNVVVSDPKLTPDTQTCPSVPPAGTCVLTGSYTTTAADYAAGDVANAATVTSDEGAGGSAAINTPITLGAGIEVSKSAVPTTINNPGDSVAYSVVVTNVGVVNLTNVTVTDPLLTLDCGGGSNVIALLPFGGSQTCTGTYIVTQDDFDAGTSLVNTANAVDGAYGVGDSDSATITLVPNPGMTVAKTGVLNDDDGVDGVSGGDTIDYTVTVENTGNVPLSNVVPSDPMAALTLVSGDVDSDGLLDADETWTFQGSYTLTQADIDGNGGGDGNIENTVTVSSDELPDQSGNAETPLNINPSMEVAKTGTLNDDDGSPGLTAGDTVTYTVTVTNTGNIRLTNVAVNDPLVTLTYQSGDTNSDNRLDVNEVWTYQGTLIITQADLDTLGGGDGDIDNTATVSTDQLPDQDASHELPIAPVSSLEIKKVATTPVQLFPTVFEFDYQLTVRNTGAVTQTNIRVEDDLVAAVAPAVLVAAPSVTTSGFAGTGGYNAGYNGSSDIQLLAGDVQLAPGGIAVITITVRIDTGAQSISALNTAFLDSDYITTPLPSDDPTVTPGDVDDISPTPVDLRDADNDGSPDGDEDDGPDPDRDSDGDSNGGDYDPTGYFYCEADGRILSGGLITVENLTSGGSQTGIGASNGIRIVRDGSDGMFQFHATQAGTYRLSYVLPPVGVASTTRLDSGTLDVTSFLPDNPGVIGSGEYGSTGHLADNSAAANPFYTVFEIEAGDPAIFNNNIPLQFCGTPEITAGKSVESGPTLLPPDLRHQVTYRLDLTASGNEPVLDVQMTDDLAAVFGAGNFTVDSATIDSAPAGFTAVINPFYDGNANTGLLTNGGTLAAGESLSILLTVTVEVVDGVYTNTLVGTASPPLEGDDVPPSSDDAGITIVNPLPELVVTKTALPGSARIGDPVNYTITVTNNSIANATGVEVVDLIPNGMSYVEGSSEIDGVPTEPSRIAQTGAGTELIWSGISLAPDDKITLTLTLIINAAAGNDEYINTAFVRDPDDGSTISNRAQAKVRREVDPVFECSDLIGRVFDDLDKDGYHDDGEPGLPGVRMATPNGLLIVSDKYGRYSIACGAIPDSDIGSNFLLKLDERTLPTGYRLTSENPRVVRLTRGKLTKLNFAAANLRVIRLELTDASFVPGSARLTREVLRSVGGLLNVLDEEPSVLRLIYTSSATVGNAARGRLKSVRELIEQAWDARARGNELVIETRLVD